MKLENFKRFVQTNGESLEPLSLFYPLLGSILWIQGKDGNLLKPIFSLKASIIVPPTHIRRREHPKRSPRLQKRMCFI